MQQDLGLQGTPTNNVCVCVCLSISLSAYECQRLDSGTSINNCPSNLLTLNPRAHQFIFQLTSFPQGSCVALWRARITGRLFCLLSIKGVLGIQAHLQGKFFFLTGPSQQPYFLFLLCAFKVVINSTV